MSSFYDTDNYLEPTQRFDTGSRSLYNGSVQQSQCGPILNRPDRIYLHRIGVTDHVPTMRGSLSLESLKVFLWLSMHGISQTHLGSLPVLRIKQSMFSAAQSSVILKIGLACEEVATFVAYITVTLHAAIGYPPHCLHQPRVRTPHHQIALTPGTQVLPTFSRSTTTFSRRQDRYIIARLWVPDCPSRFRHAASNARGRYCLGGRRCRY